MHVDNYLLEGTMIITIKDINPVDVCHIYVTEKTSAEFVEK